jgi:hypothetical protein
MKNLGQFLLDKFGTKMVGSVATKLLTVVAAMLVTRGWLDANTASNWIGVNVEVVTGVVIGAVSVWLSAKRQKQHTAEKQIAAYSAPPGYVLVPEAEATKPSQNFTGGARVGAGTTQIGRSQL